MEARLLPINALLGLATQHDINPPRLSDAGFRVVGLEVPAVGPEGKVVIDVLLFNEDSNHLIQCEAKSGSNVENGQALAYRAIPAANAIQAAYVTLRQRAVPTIETLYVCLTENVERIRTGLKSIDASFPVLAVSADLIELHDPEFASTALRGAFARELPLAVAPTRFIPFDPDSPADVVERNVRSSLVAMLANRKQQISLTGLTEDIAPHYGLYGHAAQNRLRTTVKSAVESIVASAPDRFAFDPPTGKRPEGLVRFLRTPEDFDRRGRTQAYQALGRSGRTGRQRSRVTNPDQLDLLRELDAADTEVDEIDALTDEEGDES